MGYSDGYPSFGRPPGRERGIGLPMKAGAGVGMMPETMAPSDPERE